MISNIKFKKKESVGNKKEAIPRNKFTLNRRNNFQLKLNTDIKYLMKTGGYLVEGDLVINIASIPLEDLGSSNMLKLSHVD